MKDFNVFRLHSVFSFLGFLSELNFFLRIHSKYDINYSFNAKNKLSETQEPDV